MASHDYYHNDPYSYGRREDEHLPPPPLPPTSSSFDDSHHLYQHHQPSQTSYETPTDRLETQSDPYADNDAVPLRNYRNKHDSQASVAPILQQSEYDDPFVTDAKSSKRRRRNKDKPEQGWFRGKITWVCFTLSIVQTIVLIVEMARSAILTGSPIEIHPQVNPMLGPSSTTLINLGARFPACMKNLEGVTDSNTTINWPCPNTTSIEPSDNMCSLADLCGFGGVPNPHPGGSISDTPAPSQAFRFILPIFLHAGIIHLGFNLLLQLTLGRDCELKHGSIRFTVIYFAAGIFGFVLGGNFAADGIASTGCSGSLFGILAVNLLDLLYNWRDTRKPGRELLFIVLDIAIAFVLGLLPGLDNFSHVGGFCVGIVAGICLLHSPVAFSRGSGDPGYNPAYDRPDDIKAFIKAPASFFAGRKPLWWLWWIVRIVALVTVVVGFILLLKNFYVWRHQCSRCRYISCLPVNGWCELGNLHFTQE